MNKTKRSGARLFSATTLALALAAGGDLVAAEPTSLGACDALAFDQTRDEVMTPLFEALQAGNIEQIRRYLSGPMAAEYQTLFDQNAEYGNFLRDYYDGSTFELVDIVVEDGAHAALVRVSWPDSRIADMTLRLGGEKADLGAIRNTQCR